MSVLRAQKRKFAWKTSPYQNSTSSLELLAKQGFLIIFPPDCMQSKGERTPNIKTPYFNFCKNAYAQKIGSLSLMLNRLEAARGLLYFHTGFAQERI